MAAPPRRSGRRASSDSRWARAATAGSWVTTTTAVPSLVQPVEQRDDLLSRRADPARRWARRRAAGVGRFASALAIATRCISPPDSSDGPMVGPRCQPDVLEQLCGALPPSACGRRPPRPAAAPRSPRPSASAAGRIAGTRSRSRSSRRRLRSASESDRDVTVLEAAPRRRSARRRTRGCAAAWTCRSPRDRRPPRTRRPRCGATRR